MAPEGFRQQLELLRRHRSTFSWTPGKKDFLALAREVYKGESRFSFVSPEDANQQQLPQGLIRNMNLVCIFVYYNHPELGALQLVEKMQLFHNGEHNTRRQRWVSEKAHPNERKGKQKKAAIRALKEELHIELPLHSKRLKHIRTADIVNASIPYPGIHSAKHIDDYEITLTDREYENTITLPSGEVVHGFIDAQEEKDTYFVWEPVGDSKQKEIAKFHS